MLKKQTRNRFFLLISAHPFIQPLASPFFRRGIEGVENQQLNPLSPPLKKGKAKKTANNGWILITQLVFFFSCLIFTSTSVSIDTFELTIEDVSIEQLLSVDPLEANQTGQLLKLFKLDQLSLTLDLTTTPVKLQIDLSQLDLPQPYNKISILNIICHDFSFAQNHLKCTRGHLSFQGLIAQKLTSADFIFSYDRLADALELVVENINIGTGSASFKLQLTETEWQSDFSVKKLNYQTLEPYVKYLLKQENMTDVIDKLEGVGAIMSFSGQASGKLNSDKTNENSLKLDAVNLKGKFNNVHYQYGEDLAEKLAFNFNFNHDFKSTSIATDKYNVSLSLNALSGEVLQDDIYVVFNGKERLRAKFKYNNHSIDVSSLDIISKGIFSLKSQGKILLSDNISINQLNTRIDIKNLSVFNQAYLNNILSGSDYEALQLEGGIVAQIEKNKQRLKISTQFKDFSLAFNEELSLLGLSGKLYWNNSKESSLKESQLSWQELTLNQLPLGQSSFSFIFQNDNLLLTSETDIPLFDGALHINSLNISQMFPLASSSSVNNGLTLTIDGTIKPVSLGLVSTHFDWPLLDGTLSAVIPSTTYNEKHLTVGGAMMLQLFDGVIILKDLNVDDPLQDYAQLFANIDFNNLNLKSLTKTYNFGEIEGRVEGKLTGLELSAWQPVAFDAYLRTPQNDKSRHRISQRAIDNLSSLGGASGLLSRSFLSFFETFRYDKIGISCKLKNNICHMSGVEPKGNSYYIVKGGGIPRIDVMGFQREVNWQVLTSRLKTIQRANEAVIE